jgi:transcriptional regulator with PAS, ATPase and Fis domain
MTRTTIVGESEAIEALRSKIRAAARTASSVLIQGETGTGKELVARSIYESCARHRKRFVPVDCGALPEDLVESELFGYRRGAFTTAVADKPGLFEEANHGTLFLDEIANTSPRFQVKFLRVLQEKRVRRLGDVVDRPLDVRVIAATNCDLRQMARAGDFREDLLYRLNVFAIEVPPLRKRRSDIPLLASHILDTLNRENGENRRLPRGSLEKLGAYRYPGNVRELQNLIESAFYTTEGDLIRPDSIHLPTDLPTGLPTDPPTGQPGDLRDDLPSDAPFGLSSANPMRGPTTEIAVDDFWESVARPYTDRIITKRQVEDVIRRGLAQTRGSYRGLVRLFNMPDGDYKRFMDFLRRHRCNVDFRPYRRGSR